MRTAVLRALGIAAGIVLGLLQMSAPAAARDIDFGVRGGFYDDADAAFLGAELLTDFYPHWFVNPNIEYVFVDNGSLFTLNGDVHYDFDTHAPFAVWAGAGPAVIFSDRRPDNCPNCDREDDIDLGINLLAGIGAKRGAIRPYVQGKVVLSNDTEAVIAFGLRFY